MGLILCRRQPRQPGISIHPSRVGWDADNKKNTPDIQNFNPPIPCGMGPEECLDAAAAELFQSTHPVWDGTPPPHKRGQIPPISIHPSRVGWDRAPGLVVEFL